MYGLKMNTHSAFIEWIQSKKFSHFIVIEPTPYQPFKIDEIRSRLRTLEFKVNKRYLGNNAKKYKDEDKFYFIVFPEVSVLQNKHYHVLLHTPQKVMKKKFYYERAFMNDLRMRWSLILSKNPITHKFRDFEELHKIFFCEKVKSNVASSKYQSKSQSRVDAFMNRLGEVDEDLRYFFTTPTKPQRLQSVM